MSIQLKHACCGLRANTVISMKYRSFICDLVLHPRSQFQPVVQRLHARKFVYFILSIIIRHRHRAAFRSQNMRDTNLFFFKRCNALIALVDLAHRHNVALLFFNTRHSVDLQRFHHETFIS
jgi:hypothetical protein